MTERQRTLLAEPVPLTCPQCGYTAADDNRPPLHKLGFDHELDSFECIGADDGCVFCSRCGCEFAIAAKEVQGEQ